LILKQDRLVATPPSFGLGTRLIWASNDALANTSWSNEIRQVVVIIWVWCPKVPRKVVSIITWADFKHLGLAKGWRSQRFPFPLTTTTTDDGGLLASSSLHSHPRSSSPTRLHARRQADASGTPGVRCVLCVYRLGPDDDLTVSSDMPQGARSSSIRSSKLVSRMCYSLCIRCVAYFGAE
jgi:hypothetical protein